MPSLRPLALAALALLVAAPLAAQTPTGPRLRVAVMDLSGTALSMQTTYAPQSTSTTIAIPPPAEFARGLTEMLTTALVEAGRFVVLEREAIQQALGEQDFGQSGRVNPETAPWVGMTVGAQVLVTGDITEYSYQKSSLGGNLSILRAVGATGERLNAMVALDIRLIDAVTGEVVFSKRVEGDASATGVAADVQIGDQQVGTGFSAQTPLGQASREAIVDAVAAIVEGLRDVPWSGRVVDVREGRVYVNAGSDSGITPGMRLEVFAQGDALIDPDTGLNLGAPDRKVGAVLVEAVEEKYAVASPVEGDAFQRGHLLRIAGAAARP
ncbi:MAG TPA: CsgG/HfaB family protein [Gemmatimonadota bacterium]|nr:CsgG/HfaB family protein [Gemmatimonadota bacterium]